MTNTSETPAQTTQQPNITNDPYLISLLKNAEVQQHSSKNHSVRTHFRLNNKETIRLYDCMKAKHPEALYQAYGKNPYIDDIMGFTKYITNKTENRIKVRIAGYHCIPYSEYIVFNRVTIDYSDATTTDLKIMMSLMEPFTLTDSVKTAPNTLTFIWNQ